MSSDPPPSYDAVVQQVQNSAGLNPTPEALLEAADSLPPYEKRILVENVSTDPTLNFSDDQKKAIAMGIAQTMSSPEGVEAITESASIVTANIRTLNTMFANLMQKLSSIDGQYVSPADGPFAPRLAIFVSKYNDTVRDSRTLAGAIATYAESFDTVVKGVVGDSSLTIDTKIAYLEGYIKDADDIKNKSDAMDKKFQELVSEFSIFSGKFEGWAADKSTQLNGELDNLVKEIKDMEAKLQRLQTALLAVGIAAAATLPITGILACLAGPFAPLVIVGGLIAAAVTVGTTIGLAFAIKSLKEDIAEKKKHEQELRAAIADIKNTQASLEALAKEDLAIFQQGIIAITQTWKHCSDDANTILENFKMAKQMNSTVKLGIVWEIHTNAGVNVYKTMATYLRKYAQDIVDSDISK